LLVRSRAAEWELVVAPIGRFRIVAPTWRSSPLHTPTLAVQFSKSSAGKIR
jgi:hypothetical protein